MFDLQILIPILNSCQLCLLHLHGGTYCLMEYSLTATDGLVCIPSESPGTAWGIPARDSFGELGDCMSRRSVCTISAARICHQKTYLVY